MPEIVKYKIPSTKDEMLKDAEKAGIMYDETLDADIRSLREMLIYGMKRYGGPMLIMPHVLGYKDEVVSKFL